MAELEYDGAANAIDARPGQNQVQVNDQGLIEFRYRVAGINEPGTDITLSKTFDSLVKLLQDQAVSDFALTRTTMEQVFINFAKFQVA